LIINHIHPQTTHVSPQSSLLNCTDDDDDDDDGDDDDDDEDNDDDLFML